jgi:hypothetical protein
MESREVFYDWEAELPSGLWQIGTRTLKVRTWVVVRGQENDEGSFVVRHIVSVKRHEVEPADWQAPKRPGDERRQSRV